MLRVLYFVGFYWLLYGFVRFGIGALSIDKGSIMIMCIAGLGIGQHLEQDFGA